MVLTYLYLYFLTRARLSRVRPHHYCRPLTIVRTIVQNTVVWRHINNAILRNPSSAHELSRRYQNYFTAICRVRTPRRVNFIELKSHFYGFQSYAVAQSSNRYNNIDIIVVPQSRVINKNKAWTLRVLLI